MTPGEQAVAFLDLWGQALQVMAYLLMFSLGFLTVANLK